MLLILWYCDKIFRFKQFLNMLLNIVMKYLLIEIDCKLFWLWNIWSIVASCLLCDNLGGIIALKIYFCSGIRPKSIPRDGVVRIRLQQVYLICNGLVVMWNLHVLMWFLNCEIYMLIMNFNVCWCLFAGCEIYMWIVVTCTMSRGGAASWNWRGVFGFNHKVMIMGFKSRHLIL